MWLELEFKTASISRRSEGYLSWNLMNVLRRRAFVCHVAVLNLEWSRLNCSFPLDFSASEMRLPNSPRMYPATFTTVSWQAGTVRAWKMLVA
eukprot:02498_2